MAKKSLKNVTSTERSIHFARREAAKVLRSVLKGDTERRAVGSIKSLVYKPSVRNKKATFALVCQTLKHLAILRKVLAATNLLRCKWKRQAELIYLITYDILFGQDVVSTGDAESFVLSHKESLQSSLARLVKENATSSLNLLPIDNQNNGLSKPRYVRVNTLKVDVHSTLQILQKTAEVKQDDLIPDLLILPAGTDLHSHPLVLNGSVFLQGKASCMAAVSLNPCPDWEVLDACAAPGNKTVQLAGLMKGRGKVFACELNDQRLKRLEETVKLAGASNVEIHHMDFLKLRPNALKYSKVRGILLDPSCSGSGTTFQRLDHLLPSYSSGQGKDGAEVDRINNLASFQKKALLHALSFPAVERVVYSTCSIHQRENEDVIESILPHANALNFYLATPFPEWPHRGLPVFEGAQHLLRTEAAGDMEGFFIALFVRRHDQLKHLDKSLIAESHAHAVSGNETEVDLSLPKLTQKQKDPQLDLKLELNPPSTKRKKKLKAMSTQKRSILSGLIRAGFAFPKVFHLLHIINCRKLKTRKRHMERGNLLKPKGERVKNQAM